MSKVVNDPYIQDIFHQPAPQKRRSKPSTKRASKHAEEGEYYFSLAVYKDDDPEKTVETWMEHQRVEMLEPNQRYKIVVQCDINRTQLHQRPTKIRTGFTLSLKWSTDTEVFPFTLPLDQRTLVFDRPFEQPERRYFSLPAECLTCNLTLSITYTEEGKENDYPDVVYVTLSIRGTHNPEDKKWLETHYLATGLPASTAVLVAEREGETKQCQIYGYNHRLPWLPAEVLDTSDLINVGEAIAAHETAETIFSALYDFWNGHAGALMRWLNAARNCFGAQLSVVIFDTTDLEIPWELLELYPDGYLGVVALVSRWLALDFFGHRQLLKVEDYTYQGSVISYLDHDLPGIALNEQESLRAFEHEPMHTLDRFRARLRRENALTQVGMVYLGCHGSKGTLLYAMGQRDELRVSRVIKLTWQPDPRPLFFVNACESARIVYREKTQSKVYTFVKSFLLHCASNYIGTIAEIDNGYASAIACSVLDLAKEADGVQITELLRQVRSEILKALNDLYQKEASEEECEKNRMLLLSSFLYVYYGNPLARLRLRTIAPPVEEENDEPPG